MTELDPRIVQETRKASNFVLWLFAAVGFVAASVQIISYFSSGGSDLRVRITPHNAVIEDGLLKGVQEDPGKGYVTQIADDDYQFYCEELGKTQRSNQQKQLDKEECSRADALKSFLRLLRGYDGTTKYFEYNIENTGSNTASQIKIAGNNVYAVEGVKPSSYSGHIDQRPNENFYRLPDLNPGEKLTARVWSTDTGIEPDADWISTSEFPAVTYQGGKAHVSLNKSVPSFYSDLHEFLDTFPVPITVLIVLAMATVVGVIVLIFLTVVAALVRGESVAKLFKQPNATGPATGSEAVAGDSVA